MAEKHKEEPKAEPSKPAKKENLEGIVNQTVFEKFGSGMLSGFKTVTKPFYTAGWMGGGALVSYAIAGIGPFVMASGMATGRYFIHKKTNKPYKFKHFKEEYLKGLISGTTVFPLVSDIAATSSVGLKLLKYFGYTVPAFIGTDNFVDHYIKKYETPSKLLQDVKERDLYRVVSDGVSHTLNQTPKTLLTWATNPPLVLPILAGLNWTANYPLPFKYALSAATTTGYRYFTSKEVANNKNGNNAKQAAQPNPTQEQQQALQQYLAQNPQAAQQYRNAA